MDIGLTMDYYWQLTPKQFTKHLEAYERVTKGRMQEADTLNHILGQYIRIAFNAPNKYPEQGNLATPLQQPMTDDEMEQRAIRNTMKLGGNIKT